MSQEDVEIVRRAIAAFNEMNVLVGSGDPLPWLREFCDADVELDLSRRWIDPDIYRGYEGFPRFRADYSDAWESARFDIEDVIDAFRAKPETGLEPVTPCLQDRRSTN